MAPLAARRLSDMVQLGHRIAAVELLASAQAVDRSGLRPLGAGTRPAYDLVRRHAPSLGTGDAVVHDLEPIVRELSDGALADEGS